ncbi:MarR family winged helix-turn-helix transcriptional regulator [Solwaraspora sp. WMMD791]|uniref:MarR family winged helix-turn-helix transcriptional regulator n=1 Tax=Solwaraspora sp. WMMD791 TaxID=3016086 RepID=UPI00249B5585|nr:MarR family winged helix-turn-helix transcriptional regulator [Solwaraspora sp. WMMD791]WFE28841.1 MarR family winged helix-turn-helix transcriptional regulator [Solwaraspora sp. WMMD791]
MTATLRSEDPGGVDGDARFSGNPDEHPIAELRYLILAAQREGNRLLAQALRPLGLTPAQAEILSVLAEREPLTLAALGRYIVCETGSPSRIVETLFKRGLVEREAGQVDRRVVHLRLTLLGAKMLDDVNAINHALNESIGSQLNDEQRKTMVEALHRILQDTISGSKINQRFGSAAGAALEQRSGYER